MLGWQYTAVGWFSKQSRHNEGSLLQPYYTISVLKGLQTYKVQFVHTLSSLVHLKHMEAFKVSFCLKVLSAGWDQELASTSASGLMSSSLVTTAAHLPACLSDWRGCEHCHIHGPVPPDNTLLIEDRWSPWHPEWKNSTWQHDSEHNGFDKRATAPIGNYTAAPGQEVMHIV